MLVSLLAMLLVCYVLTRAGLMFIESGQQVLSEEDQVASQDRMVKYSAWLKGANKKGKIKFAKTCVESEHAPMVLFNQRDRTKVDSVICSKCTDTLPTPAEYSCKDCWVISVDGYLHVEPCDRHGKKEPVLL